MQMTVLTPTQRQILKFFADQQNAPCTMYTLLALGRSGTVTGAVEDLLERGTLEKVEAEYCICLKLKEAGDGQRAEAEVRVPGDVLEVKR